MSQPEANPKIVDQQIAAKKSKISNSGRDRIRSILELFIWPLLSIEKCPSPTGGEMPPSFTRGIVTIPLE